jgi:pentatricopeptide repeat protein
MMENAGIEPTEGTYALLINRYLEDSNLEMAFKHLVEMENRGLTPTLLTAEGVITLAGRRRMPRLALELAENFEGSSVRRLGMHVWVSCLLSSSECLYVSAVLNHSGHALIATSMLLRKRASSIYGQKLQMNSRFYQMRVALSRCFMLPAVMDSPNWLWMCSVF